MQRRTTCVNNILHVVQRFQTSFHTRRCRHDRTASSRPREAVVKRSWPLVAAGALTIAAVLVALSLAVSSRDPSGVATREGPGEALADQCARHSAPPEGFAYATSPPASGPHRPRLARGDERQLSDDELLHALELGNVVLAYDARRPPTALRRLRDDIAGPYDAELAAAGQAVLVVEHPAAEGITALAWARRLRTADAADPTLREFTEHWLGQGARGRKDACRPAG